MVMTKPRDTTKKVTGARPPLRVVGKPPVVCFECDHRQPLQGPCEAGCGGYAGAEPER